MGELDRFMQRTLNFTLLDRLCITTGIRSGGGKTVFLSTTSNKLCSCFPGKGSIGTKNIMKMQVWYMSFKQ